MGALLARCVCLPAACRGDRFACLPAVSCRALRAELCKDFKNMQAEAPQISRKNVAERWQEQPRLRRTRSRECWRNCLEHRPNISCKKLPGGSKIAPKWLQNASRRAPGGLRKPKTKAAPFFEPFLAPLGRSWGAPGGSWGRLGASWAALGASWAAPGTHCGLPGASFCNFLGLFFKRPWKETKT